MEIFIIIIITLLGFLTGVLIVYSILASDISHRNIIYMIKEREPFVFIMSTLLGILMSVIYYSIYESINYPIYV